MLDTLAIQDAIADAPVEGTVYFPSGKYVVDATVVIDKRINLVGDGLGTQIF